MVIYKGNKRKLNRSQEFSTCCIALTIESYKSRIYFKYKINQQEGKNQSLNTESKRKQGHLRV